MGFQSMAEYRKHAKREIMKNQLIGREVSSRIKVDASEVQRVFSEKYGSGTNVEERRVGHVLIRLAELAPKAQVLAAEAKLKKLRADIVAGKDSFEEMARRHSQDTTAPAGGDIGWISRGDTDPDFEKTAFRIQKGVVSKPVRSSFGYHLVKVTEVRTKHVLTPDKKKSLLRQIRYRLREKQLMSLYKQWVKTLRADSFVEKKALLHELLGR
jgi:peptidyl-prolyl cis-trans isomerase SurA